MGIEQSALVIKQKLKINPTIKNKTQYQQIMDRW